MKKEGRSFGRNLSRFIVVISAVAIVLRLWSKGMIDAEKATIFLVLVVFAAAIDSVWVKLILALFGLGYFLLDYMDYDLVKFQSAAVLVGALLLALFGFFIILGGMRRK